MQVSAESGEGGALSLMLLHRREQLAWCEYTPPPPSPPQHSAANQPLFSCDRSRKQRLHAALKEMKWSIRTATASGGERGCCFGSGFNRTEWNQNLKKKNRNVCRFYVIVKKVFVRFFCFVVSRLARPHYTRVSTLPCQKASSCCYRGLKRLQRSNLNDGTLIESPLKHGPHPTPP